MTSEQPSATSACWRIWALSTAFLLGSPQPRRKRSGGGAGPLAHANRAEHADSIRDHAIRSIQTHHLRSPVLGVEPELVLVIELAHRLDPELLERAELRVLDLTGELAMVAFASDPELTGFLRRLDAYHTGPRRDESGTEGSAPYEALFDAIVRPRPLEVGDVLSPALRSHLASLDHLAYPVKIDVQCWCPDAAVARVVNLSLGDPRRPYHPPRPTVLAADIDDLSRRLGLVVVISAGNYPLAQHSRAERVINDYPTLILEDESGGLLDPAPAALALTVGALCADFGQGAVPSRENIDRQPLGMAGHPSPATRTGPGPLYMIKPELCAPGGGFSYDHGTQRLIERDPSVHVLGADGSRPDRLLATGAGTSFAAPLFSHAALRVLGAYPALTSNGVRALLLASVEPTPPVIEIDSKAVARKQQARLTGYGRVSAERAEASNDHRAVLLAEEVMRVNDVHVFTVPLPSSFTERGGWRRLTVALAYNPPVRPTRLDYLASRMDFWAFCGITLEQVRDAYAAPLDDTNAVPATLTNSHLKLQPSTTLRSPGANQWASREFPPTVRW